VVSWCHCPPLRLPCRGLSSRLRPRTPITVAPTTSSHAMPARVTRCASPSKSRPRSRRRTPTPPTCVSPAVAHSGRLPVSRDSSGGKRLSVMPCVSYPTGARKLGARTPLPGPARRVESHPRPRRQSPPRPLRRCRRQVRLYRHRLRHSPNRRMRRSRRDLARSLQRQPPAPSPPPQPQSRRCRHRLRHRRNHRTRQSRPRLARLIQRQPPPPSRPPPQPPPHSRRPPRLRRSRLRHRRNHPRMRAIPGSIYASTSKKLLSAALLSCALVACHSQSARTSSALQRLDLMACAIWVAAPSNLLPVTGRTQSRSQCSNCQRTKLIRLLWT